MKHKKISNKKKILKYKICSRQKNNKKKISRKKKLGKKISKKNKYFIGGANNNDLEYTKFYEIYQCKLDSLKKKEKTK